MWLMQPGSRSVQQTSDVRTVDSIARRRQLTLGLKRKTGLSLQEFCHHAFVFLRFQAARAVNERPTRFEPARRFVEQTQLGLPQTR